MKKTLFLLLFSILLIEKAHSQSMVTEISWYDSNYINYKGLLVLYPSNQGFLKVKYYLDGVGTVWVYQNATLTNRYDNYGNCTSYINCSYPKCYPNIPYSADNFVVFPDGSMYTQDYSGNWSTLITAWVVNNSSWRSKFNEYGVQ